jgi:cytidylate kinase
MIFTVAIDGPAAAGKGTISKAVAAHFGFAHLDTGLLYRAVGAKVLAGADPVAAAKALDPVDLENDSLRTPEVAQAASEVAVISEVRAALVDFQKAFARREGGAVLDGRDIGTVICPEAEVKLFVTASPDCRAARRFAEMQAKGVEVTLAAVLEDVKARDARDTSRTTAPLMSAEDAVLLDTSDMTVDEAVAQAIAVVADARGGGLSQFVNNN